MMRVTPHPVFAASVSARRGAGDHASPLPVLHAPAVWAEVQKLTTMGNRNYWINLVKDDPTMQRAVAMIRAAALPDPFDARTVAAAERLIPRRGYLSGPTCTLVRVVAEARGVAEMVAMKLDSTAMGIKRDQNHIEIDSDDPDSYDASWDVARTIICRSDEASYAKARDVAAEWREKRPVIMRVAADFLFPSETGWADADIDEIITLSKTNAHVLYRAQPLLAVTSDERRVTAFIDAVIASGTGYHLHAIAGKWSCDLAVGLQPESALAVLLKLLKEVGRGAGKTELAMLGHAIAALEGEEAAQELAGMLLHPAIGPVAVDYFRRFPELAKVVLPKTAQGTSKAADAARSILASLTRKDESVPLAQGDEVPTLLRETPWRKKKKGKAVALGALPPPPTTTIAWRSDEEKQDALAGKLGYYGHQELHDMPAGVVEQWERQDARHRSVDIWFGGRGAGTYRVPDTRGLREWNENPEAMAYMGPLRLLAIHGEAALPGLFARDVFSAQWTADALFNAQLHTVGPDAARMAASAVVRRKAWRKAAQQWIAGHARVVAMSLVPAALGKDGRERKEAENAIRWAARGGRDDVLDAARMFGADAEHAIRELCDRDPLTDLEVKGKLPPFVRLEDLPSVKTRVGKRLPEEAMNALLEILRSSSPEVPYAGIDLLREELDESSLAELSWALVQAWILAGGKATFEWIPMSLVLVGDDSCARRIAPYVREWARKDRKKASMAALVLAAMGSSTALLHLSYVADKSRFEDAKAHAKEALERVAAEQGLTTDELADRTVPDLELDKGGTTTLDFGPRSFTVTFDEGLKPVIKAEDGSRLPAFPRGTKTDDAAKVKAAQARFKALKGDAESVAQTLLRRLETAMCRGRTWRADAFRTYVLDHPLVTHLARRLIWQASGIAFRVADDGTLADVKDVEYTLKDDALVSLPHPLTLGKDEVVAWSRIATDYAIVQPFEQLGRATYTLSESEAQSSKLERFEGKTSKPGPLMGSLDARGWQKYADETSLSTCGKKVRKKSGGEAHVSLGFEPGIDFDDVAHAPDQVLHAPSLGGAESWAAIDPVDLSELIRDLELIAR